MALKHNKQQSLQQHVLQQHHGTVDSQSEGSILKLPVEILDMIATKLDDYGLKSMRSTCRHLRIGTFYEFAERSTSSHVEIVTTNGKIAMRKLTVTLRSPNLVKAKAAMTQLLALHDPLYANEIHPEKTLVSNTVTSNPNAWTFQQQKNYKQAHEYCLAPLIFARVAYLPPQTTNLRRLVIEGADLDGDGLLEVLITHKHHLRRVVLRKVTITKFINCVLALCRSKTQNFEFEDLEVRDTQGRDSLVTRDLRVFPKFKRLMRLEWELSAGFGSSRFVYERGSDTARVGHERDSDTWLRGVCQSQLLL
jgi:hypothetical protein